MEGLPFETPMGHWEMPHSPSSRDQDGDGPRALRSPPPRTSLAHRASFTLARNRTSPNLDAALISPRLPWSSRESTMSDLIFIAVSVGFFALAVGYTFACEKLEGSGHD
jgi:hypothetical protein